MAATPLSVTREPSLLSSVSSIMDGRFGQRGAPAAGYQVPGSANTKYEPVGVQATDQTVTTNRRWIWVLVIGVLVVAAFCAAAFVIAVEDRVYKVHEDSLKNVEESKNVEIFLQNDVFLDGGTICSGVFIRETGEILTAAHCFYTQDPDACDFDPGIPGYPTTVETLSIEVMNVNKTGAKYTFDGEIIAFSGLTDIAIIKPLPLTRSDGSVISVINQHHYGFKGTDLERGDVLNGFAYDLGFFKKVTPIGRPSAFSPTVSYLVFGV